MPNAHPINWPVIICPITNRSLDRIIVEERLTAFESWRTFNDCMHGDFESLSYMISEGCGGFSDYSDEDLLAEWMGSELGFVEMIDLGEAPYSLLESDPLNQKERQAVVNE